MAAVPQVETHCIAGQKLAYDRCDRNISRSQKQQILVIGLQGSGVKWHKRHLQQALRPFDKIIRVCIISENSFSLF